VLKNILPYSDVNPNKKINPLELMKLNIMLLKALKNNKNL